MYSNAIQIKNIQCNTTFSVPYGPFSFTNLPINKERLICLPPEKVIIY